MSTVDDRPIVARQTTAQNEAVETVLARLNEKEIFIPRYQRDSDEWDDVKKSLFIESILNRLTVPAFYLAQSETGEEHFEVVDGQQRLTTLQAFYSNDFQLADDMICPYFGPSVHYSGQRYEKLDDEWKKAFRRYNLTLVTLPPGMELNLRLEIFRRINEGGTPLSGQDIRLSYYSESPAVRFVQLAGIYDPERMGALRMVEYSKEDFDWPWRAYPEDARQWKIWWNNTKTVTGQTSSEMFLWYITSKYKDKVDRILSNKTHLTEKLRLGFRDRTEEVLDIVCAQLRYEDVDRPSIEPRLLPDVAQLKNELFEQFRQWWLGIRQKCTGQVNVVKYRAVAMLIPGLGATFGSPKNLSDSQWGWLGKLIAGTRKTAEELGVDFPESKGRWRGSRGAV